MTRKGGGGKCPLFGSGGRGYSVTSGHAKSGVLMHAKKYCTHNMIYIYKYGEQSNTRQDKSNAKIQVFKVNLNHEGRHKWNVGI